MNRKKALLVAFISLCLSGCGAGLCADMCLSALANARFLLSGLDGLVVRKNDCYPVTLSAVDAAGNAATKITAAVTITASTGVVLYSSLQGCQTYSSSDEKSTFTLSPGTPQAVFYFRADVEGQVSLSASGSIGDTVVTGSQGVSVQYSAYDGASGLVGTVNSIAQASTGQVYLGGTFLTYDELTVSYVTRFNTDGTHDSSFLPVGTGLNNEVKAVAVQADGQIVVGGQFTSYNGNSRARVARLNTDGSLDNSFAPTGTGFNGIIESVAIQSDGKIVVGGWFTSYNGTTRGRVARLNSDGSLDTTFAPTGTGLDSTVWALSIQTDGKIVAAGSFSFYNGSSKPRVARLLSDGTLDATFSPSPTHWNNDLYCIAIQSDGKYVVGGLFTTYNAVSRPYLARHNADGSLDVSFVQTGTGLDGAVEAVMMQGDGKILAAGTFTSYNGTSRPYVARMNSDGSLDTSFTQTGTGFNNSASQVLVQSDLRVVVAGAFTSYDGVSRPRIAVLSAAGSLDGAFEPSGAGFDNIVWEFARQSDGKTVAVGAFTSHSGTPQRRVARLNSDGSLDTSFSTSGTGLNAQAKAVAIQNDGKIVAGGWFTSYNGTARQYIARLESNGALDTTFVTTGAGLNNSPETIVIQPDGKILVGGQFSTYNGASVAYVARLNSDGSRDGTFGPTGTGLSGSVWALALLSDGKILVGGQFSSYNGTSRPAIAKLNSDGSLDTSLAPVGSGLSLSVFTLAVQNDEKILVGGFLSSYNGTAVDKVARLNADGSLDTSFVQTGSGLTGFAYAIAVQPDGRIVVGGDLSSSGGKRGLARFNSDGSADTTFYQQGSYLNDTVEALSLQSDAKIIVGGRFSAFGQSTVGYLARLTYIGTLD